MKESKGKFGVAISEYMVKSKVEKSTNHVTCNSRATNADIILQKLPINYYIYLHRKQDTDEVFYVGKGFSNRCVQLQNRSVHWTNIVNKHGYYVEIIKDNLSEKEAFDLEIQYIKEYGRINLNTGVLCNLTDGGEGSSGIKFSDEWKDNMSKRVTADGNPMYGKRFYGELNPNYGNTRGLNAISKAVIALNLDGSFIKEYECLADTENDGYCPTTVSLCCNGLRQQHGSTQFIFKSEYDKNKQYNYNRGKTSIRAVVQLEIIDNAPIIIDVFDSIRDVLKKGYSDKVVQGVCSGTKKSYKGYIWKYLDSFDVEVQEQIREALKNNK